MEYFYSSSSDQDSRRERLYWASVVLNDMGIQMIEGMDLEGALDAFRDAIRAFRTGSRISCVQENECNSISFRIEQAEARLRRSHESGPLDLHPFRVVVLDQGTSPQALRVLQYGPSSLIIAPMRLQMRSCRTPPKQEERDVHLAVLLYNMSIVHVCIARLCEDIDDEEEDEGFLHWVKCANLLEKAQSLVETHSMISENMGVYMEGSTIHGLILNHFIQVLREMGFYQEAQCFVERLQRLDQTTHGRAVLVKETTSWAYSTAPAA